MLIIFIKIVSHKKHTFKTISITSFKNKRFYNTHRELFNILAEYLYTAISNRAVLGAVFKI